MPPIRRLLNENASLKQQLKLLDNENAAIGQQLKLLENENATIRQHLKPSYTKDLFPFCGLEYPEAESKSKSRHTPATFMVTSWGHCGSIWFAGALNLNERVFSTVGIGHPLPSSMIFELNKDLRGWLDLPQECIYKYGITTDEKSYLIRHGITLQNNPDLRADRDTADLPRFVFDELETIFTYSGENYSVLGNIHGTTLDQLDRAFKANPKIFAERRVIVMDLIRHPVPRTESAIKATMNLHLQKLDSSIADFIAKNARECLELERKYKIDFSEPRARASLHVFRQGIQNDVWVYELVHFPQIQRILMERLRNEPEYFSSVFYILSQGREMAERTFLDRVFSEENLVKGRQTTEEMKTRTLRPFEQYERWSGWEQEEFSRVAERLNMPKVYMEYGYDFSFLSRAPFSGGTWLPDLQHS